MDEYEGFWVDGSGSGLNSWYGYEPGDGYGQGDGNSRLLGEGYGRGYIGEFYGCTLYDIDRNDEGSTSPRDHVEG